MKKIILIVLLATLCIFFKASAQNNKAIDVTTKGIQVGQQVPEFIINNIHNYKTTNAKLSDFKGKLVIIDFWATWCSPCLAMIPKMDSLQKQFGDTIQFLKVTYQPAQHVIPFLEKFQKGKQSRLPEVTDDKALHKLFPHIYLPHFVWINNMGTVVAITDADEITSAKITLILKGTTHANLPTKHDMSITYERDSPLFISGNGGNGSTTIAHSILSAYTVGLNGGYSITRDSGEYSKVTVTNRGVVGLYRVAYGEKEYIGNNRVRLLTKDSVNLLPKVAGKLYLDWLRAGNGFCYELMLPRRSQGQLFNRMIQELDSYFPQYQVSMEMMNVKCLVLSSQPNAANDLKTKGSAPHVEYSRQSCNLLNTPLSEFMEQMSVVYFQSQYPLVDESGITDGVDLNFSADMTNVSSVNAALAPYGLQFQIAERPINILVFRDQIYSSKK
ncbi:Thiol-disulfide isomerase or thioredoxin [Pedobacter sp. ok626]|uniref:TlpA family protein disulfide reductase n=1 Tax=Pedobacter sp. ok626 TaxID=1761882 RepID=UPI000884086C|nr:TlpA family protein disulfide reductase [Pedobacter sp. ok626]SDL11217.1 Thiol-disulfide isomerase or thioredoxin [Pedobacter sp. ok626]